MGLLDFLFGRKKVEQATPPDGASPAPSSQPASTEPEPTPEPEPEQDHEVAAETRPTSAQEVANRIAELDAIIGDNPAEEPEAEAPAEDQEPATSIAVPAALILAHLPADCLNMAATDLAAQYANRPEFIFTFDRAEVMFGLSRGKLEFTVGDLASKLPLPIFSRNLQAQLENKVAIPLHAVVPLVPPQWFMRNDQDDSRVKAIEEIDDLFEDLLAEEKPEEEVAVAVAEEPATPAPEPVAEVQAPRPRPSGPTAPAEAAPEDDQDTEEAERQAAAAKQPAPSQPAKPTFPPRLAPTRIAPQPITAPGNEPMTILVEGATNRRSAGPPAPGRPRPQVVPAKLQDDDEAEPAAPAATIRTLPASSESQRPPPSRPVPRAFQAEPEPVPAKQAEVTPEPLPAEPAAKVGEMAPEVAGLAALQAALAQAEMPNTHAIAPSPLPATSTPVLPPPPPPEPVVLTEAPTEAMSREAAAALARATPESSDVVAPVAAEASPVAVPAAEPEAVPVPEPTPAPVVAEVVAPPPPVSPPVAEPEPAQVVAEAAAPPPPSSAAEPQAAPVPALVRQPEPVAPVVTAPVVPVAPPALLPEQPTLPLEMAASAEDEDDDSAEGIEQLGRQVFGQVASLSQSEKDLTGLDEARVAYESQAPNGININRAGIEELMLLRGVGEHLAKAIIECRTNYGPFSTLQDLLEVPGLGNHTFRAMTGLTPRTDLRQAELELNRVIELDQPLVSIGRVCENAQVVLNLSAIFLNGPDGLLLHQATTDPRLAKLAEPLAAVTPQLFKRTRRAIGQAKLPPPDMFTCYIGNHAVTMAGSEDVTCACVHHNAIPTPKQLRSCRLFFRELMWYCSFRAVL